MTLINNKKTHESRSLTGKGKHIIKVVDQSLIKQAWRVKDKISKTN